MVSATHPDPLALEHRDPAAFGGDTRKILRAWCEQEFNAKYVDETERGFVDVMAGRREGNTFEVRALNHLFGMFADHPAVLSWG